MKIEIAFQACSSDSQCFKQKIMPLCDTKAISKRPQYGKAGEVNTSWRQMLQATETLCHLLSESGSNVTALEVVRILNSTSRFLRWHRGLFLPHTTKPATWCECKPGRVFFVFRAEVLQYMRCVSSSEFKECRPRGLASALERPCAPWVSNLPVNEKFRDHTTPRSTKVLKLTESHPSRYDNTILKRSSEPGPQLN